MRAAAVVLLAGSRPLTPTHRSTLSTRARSRPPIASDGASDDGGLHSLLLQRAIQTCCYTARSCRDPPTAQWLADRAGVAESHHGVDAFAAKEWEPWLLTLLREPAVTIEVESILKKNRGVSASNPYVQPRRMTYKYELRPSELAERVMETTVTISREFIEDLALMEAEGESVWRSRRAVTLDSDEEVRTTMPARSNDPTTPGMESPYRAGSYELLLALATRRAAQAALAALSAQPKSWAASELLESHCAAHGLFDGELRRNAANVWIAELLDQPISVRVGDTGEPTLVDPRGIVEQILEWRAAVAANWTARLESVPERLLDIRRQHARSSVLVG